MTVIDALNMNADEDVAEMLRPRPRARVSEAQHLVLMDMCLEAIGGNRRILHKLEETLSTSDFSYLFADTLDREALAQYQQLPKIWPAFASRITLRDFRPKKLVDLLGGRSILDPVKELAPYAARGVSDAEYTITPGKYGDRFAISWEMLVNDDLGELASLPGRLAQAANDTEDYYATSMLVSGGTLNANLFGSTVLPDGSSNLIASNPVLSTDNLSAALTAIGSRHDTEGRPVQIPRLVLVVGPALKVTAKNILNATLIRLKTTNEDIEVNNWLAGEVDLVVDPWLPILDPTHGATAWYVLPAPSTARPAVAMGFLAGHEVPDLRVKSAQGQSLGGGTLVAEDGSFEVDDIQYRIRHVIGTTSMDPIGAAASNGSGS